MKKKSILPAIEALAQRLGLRKPFVILTPTEYQKHVAEKAKELRSLMEHASEKNPYMTEMLNGMKQFFEEVIACKIALPNSTRSSWSWYFVYENPERLDLQYPAICEAAIHLNTLMCYDSFEKLEAFYNMSKSLRRSS